MLGTFDIPITWTELVKRTVRETMNDNVTGLAAQLAYYFFLALFPTLLFFIALASYFPGDVLQSIVEAASRFAPEEMMGIIRSQIRQLAAGEDGGLLTIGIAGALWSSSAAMVGIVDAMNRAYDIEEGRPWWKVRLTAIALTVALALFILVSFTLVLLGPTIAGWLADRLGFGPVFEWSWKILQWPLVLALVTLGLAFVNYFAPDAEQDWVWVTPGAVLATVLWLVATLGFKFYVVNFGSYNETYGTVGGVIVLLLWFYLSGLAILVGAEMNAEIEHASPHGKAAGEKVPGEKKKLGAAAARAYEEARQRPAAPQAGVETTHGSKARAHPPFDLRPTAPVPASTGATSATSKWPGLLVLAAGLMFRRRRRRAPGA